MRKFLVLSLLLVLVGCIYTPKIAPSEPIYAKPTLTLEEKAFYQESMIYMCSLDEDGALLYRNYPMNVNGFWVRDPTDTAGYDVADFPAWQGQLISALAFEWAVTGINKEYELTLALNGLETCYKATGIPGQLVRSYIRHNSDTPLPWMKLEQQAHDNDSESRGWWQRGQQGYWFRNQVAGGHHQGVWTAFCVLGALQQQGKINLSPVGVEAARRAIVPLYNRIEQHGGDVVDIDGKTTGYGDEDAYGILYSRALWHLTRHKAGALWGVTEAQERYDNLIEGYANMTYDVSHIMVYALKRLPLSKRPLGASDIHWIHHSWLGLIVANGADADENMCTIRKGFHELYEIHDPFNAHDYIIQKAGHLGLTEGLPEMYDRMIEAMEWYPTNKFKFSEQELKETDDWQPIQNRDITTSYAKTSAHDKALKGEHTNTPRTNQYSCGFDYVLCYWMGRYFGVINQ